jgi:hypothetical protein
MKMTIASRSDGMLSVFFSGFPNNWRTAKSLPNNGISKNRRPQSKIEFRDFRCFRLFRCFFFSSSAAC